MVRDWRQSHTIVGVMRGSSDLPRRDMDAEENRRERTLKTEMKASNDSPSQSRGHWRRQKRVVEKKKEMMRVLRPITFILPKVRLRKEEMRGRSGLEWVTEVIRKTNLTGFGYLVRKDDGPIKRDWEQYVIEKRLRKRESDMAMDLRQCQNRGHRR